MLVYLKDEHNKYSKTFSPRSFMEKYAEIPSAEAGWAAYAESAKIKSHDEGYDSKRWEWINKTFVDKFESDREYKSLARFRSSTDLCTDGFFVLNKDNKKQQETVFGRYAKYVAMHCVFTTPGLNSATIAHANAAAVRLVLGKSKRYVCIAGSLDQRNTSAC